MRPLARFPVSDSQSVAVPRARPTESVHCVSGELTQELREGATIKTSPVTLSSLNISLLLTPLIDLSTKSKLQSPNSKLLSCSTTQFVASPGESARGARRSSASCQTMSHMPKAVISDRCFPSLFLSLLSHCFGGLSLCFYPVP